ncbi:MAG: UDP-N-acetylmuramoyl-L-alanine--D-glutamate ligase [Candidatus Rokubacteria bacterium]|nr:UDP-N-acetylmuramoyl-L-alanine--D-glutamate ligase [Candidatus Rokubacteria bacterium]
MRGSAYRDWLRGRRVSVVGLARSGVAVAELLTELGAVVTATDAKPLSSLSPEARGLGATGILLYAGGHPPEAFGDAELVVVSPGVPADHPALAPVRARGVPVIGELELAWQVMEAEVIAITGTNGKTTTTALVGALLREQIRPVLVGGNIGTPLAAHALDFPPGGIVVAEVSSFQLETVETFRPRVAAVLNLTPDHLDRHGSFGAYVAAKARIFENQTERDSAVLNFDDARTAALAVQTKADVIFFSRQRPLERGVFCQDGWILARLNGHTEPICPLGEISLRGQHNVENVLAAAACALWTGIGAASIRTAITAFRAVPHRLEWIRDIGGVAYYNDSKGTNVASTVKALESFAEPLILIAGGRGKGQDFAPLAKAAAGRVRLGVLVGEDRDRIGKALAAAAIPVAPAGSMDEAVRLASAAARPGEVVLLSPACASFDMFENFERRGDAFRAAVLALAAQLQGGVR